MAVNHPIDALVRERLRARFKQPGEQTQFARAIHREQSWFNKYVHGAGHATVDDVVRMLAVLDGLQLPKLSELEQTLLKAIRALPESDQLDVLDYVGIRAKPRARRGPSTKSSETTARTLRGIGRTAHGKQPVGTGTHDAQVTPKTRRDVG